MFGQTFNPEFDRDSNVDNSEREEGEAEGAATNIVNISIRIITVSTFLKKNIWC